MYQSDGSIILEDAEILYRNFSGIEGQYNNAGSRNFCVILDPARAEQMIKDGWNIKQTKVRDEGDEPRFYVQVQIGYKIRPPRIQMITKKRGKEMRTDVPEDLVSLLDWVDIEKVDMIIRPRHYNVNGNTGIKAYLKSLYITIAVDYLEEKYADVEEYQIETGDPVLQIADHAHEDEDVMDLDSEYVDD